MLSKYIWMHSQSPSDQWQRMRPGRMILRKTYVFIAMNPITWLVPVLHVTRSHQTPRHIKCIWRFEVPSWMIYFESSRTTCPNFCSWIHWLENQKSEDQELTQVEKQKKGSLLMTNSSLDSSDQNWISTWSSLNLILILNPLLWTMLPMVLSPWHLHCSCFYHKHIIILCLQPLPTVQPCKLSPQCSHVNFAWASLTFTF